MAEKNDWWTAPTVGDKGGLVLVSGRRDVDYFRRNGRYINRITISWVYADDGMPDDDVARLMEQATDAMAEVFASDPVAVLTGIYTGDGRRDWVFYTLSNNIFGRKINEALADLPLLPLEISAELDPDWQEYEEMRALTEISPGNNRN